MIFLVGAAAISSVLELSRFYEPTWSVLRSVDYYVERLDSLAHMARTQPGSARATFMTYEDLTERPRETLSRLQSMLSIEPAFSETYRIHEFTGRRGDPGANIRSGRIGSASPPAHPDLPPEEVERATRAHAACLEAMAPFALMPQATS